MTMKTDDFSLSYCNSCKRPTLKFKTNIELKTLFLTKPFQKPAVQKTLQMIPLKVPLSFLLKSIKSELSELLSFFLK